MKNISSRTMIAAKSRSRRLGGDGKIYAAFTLTLSVAFLLLSGCSQKFNTAAPYKNVTIIYGYLDMSDTSHYIRIEKAFSDQNKSAYTMVQIPDSSYYEHLNVRMERYEYPVSGNYHDTIH